MLGSVPPAPIAAFGDHQFFEGQAAPVFRDAGGGIESLPRAQQFGPGPVVFLGADPDVKIGVDPGAGENMVERFRRQ